MKGMNDLKKITGYFHTDVARLLKQLIKNYPTLEFDSGAITKDFSCYCQGFILSFHIKAEKYLKSNSLEGYLWMTGKLSKSINKCLSGDPDGEITLYHYTRGYEIIITILFTDTGS